MAHKHDMMKFLRFDPAPWLFAAKTTGASLLALLIAFTFDLDQPQWAVLTVFVVSQPGTSGGILGKSCFRFVGTAVGTAAALVLVGLFAQERDLFLGALALWVGLCTYGSQRVRGWSNYAFVLSGYTAAIVGIPATLEPEHCFYIATARMTEICLGILVGTGVNQLVLPVRMAGTLAAALAEARPAVAGFAARVLARPGREAPGAPLVALATRIEDLLDTALFEDPATRRAAPAIRAFVATLLDVLAAARPLERRGRTAPPLHEAAAAVRAWGIGRDDAATLAGRLHAAPPATQAAATLLAAVLACARADAALAAGQPVPSGAAALDPGDERLAAAATGVRSALAVVVSGAFWVLTAWDQGAVATLLSALGCARAATMGHVIPLAIMTELSFLLATGPAFVVIEVLLPHASGFAMFALLVGPMLFLFAFMMAHRKTMLAGYMGALLLLQAGTLQNRMVYDPVTFLNIVLAALFAVVVAFLLWALVAPDTPRKHRLRFVRATRRAMQAPIGARRFGSAVGGALVRLARELKPDRPGDQATFETALALLGAGRELGARTRPASALKAVRAAMAGCARALDCRVPQVGEMVRAVATLDAALDGGEPQDAG